MFPFNRNYPIFADSDYENNQFNYLLNQQNPQQLAQQQIPEPELPENEIQGNDVGYKNFLKVQNNGADAYKWQGIKKLFKDV